MPAASSGPLFVSRSVYDARGKIMHIATLTLRRVYDILIYKLYHTASCKFRSFYARKHTFSRRHKEVVDA